MPKGSREACLCLRDWGRMVVGTSGRYAVQIAKKMVLRHKARISNVPRELGPDCHDTSSATTLRTCLVTVLEELVDMAM